MRTRRIHAYVLAGGSGTRLRPLTDDHCKPALPFGAGHRVVDFVLANLRNSGVGSVDVLVQYRPESLVAHLQHAWSDRSTGADAFTPGIARPSRRPVGRLGAAGYLGTADAVFQNLSRADLDDGDLVAVLGADHVYRMDLRQMAAFHEQRRADVSVAALPVPLADASAFGVIETGDDGRAIGFHEKPRVPPPMPGEPTRALVSMGNYLFSARTLKAALAECCAAGEHDFGHHVLPRLVRRARVMAYDFRENVIPGTAAHEEPGYWRDVGTLDAYLQANLDTLGTSPRFALDNPHWPLSPRAAEQVPALVVRGETRCSRLGSAAVVDRALLDCAVLGAGVRVSSDARLERCVLFDGVVVGRSARLRNVIVSEDNTIPDHACIGYDAEHDRARFPVSPGGVVVVPRGYFAPHRIPSDADRVPVGAHG